MFAQIMQSTVAVIDSDASERQALRTLLSVLNVDVRSFDSAESFLAQYAAERHRAVVCCAVVDVRLSGISGLQLLRQLRVTGDDLPLILLATEPDITTAVEAMRLGAADFIEKSRLDVALLRRITQILHERENHRPLNHTAVSR